MYSQEYNERVKLFKDAISFNKPKRIPNISNFFTWKICDSEFTFKEALYDYKKMEKLTVDFHKRYDFDAYMDLGTRNPMAVTDVLGSSCYSFDEATDSICVTDKVFMSADEYEIFAENPNAFMRKMFERKYPHISAKELSDSISNFLTFGQYSMKITKKFSEELSRPAVFNMRGAILMPYEFFNSVGRGIKELALDVRRHPEVLISALDAYYSTFTKPAVTAMLEKDSSMYVTDCYTALLGYGMLNPKQFERVYWPHLKQYIDTVVKADKTIYIFCESTMDRLSDFFADVPRGHIILHMELDSLYDVRKKCPKACLAGGMTTDLLGYKTSSECVDEAKRLIDTLGEGFIMSQNKMMSFKNDCKRENLLAVNDFVRNYTL